MDHQPHLLVKTQFLFKLAVCTNLHEPSVTIDDIKLQIMWLSLGFVPTASGDFMWYVTNNVTVLPDSYGKVITNTLLH